MRRACAALKRASAPSPLTRPASSLSQFGSGPATVCILPTPTPSQTPTPSVTPTLSISSTPSLSPSPTPTTTASLSASPSRTATSSQSPTQTPTPSQTPSPSTVPDVLVYFALNLVPLQGGLTVSNIVALPAFLQSSAAAFAALIRVPPSQVYAVNVSQPARARRTHSSAPLSPLSHLPSLPHLPLNERAQVTDLATGAFASVGSIRRQLGGSPGSQGVAVTFVVRLGKTPTQADVSNLTAVLASPTLAASTLRSITVQLGAATQLGAAAFALSVPAAGVKLTNAPFVLGVSVVAVSATADNSGAAGGAAAGGIIGAIALACCVWARRSYNKHKK